MAAIYTDTTLTPAAGYTYIHAGQQYAETATRLAAHAAWSLVDTQDWVTGATTWRTYIWKCAAAVSGLTADFYVAFRVSFTTTGTVYSTTAGMQWYLFESYDVGTHTASKPAAILTSTAAVIAADNTHPATWVTTANPLNFAYTTTGFMTTVTSLRLITLVDNDMVTQISNQTLNALPLGAYAGTFETTLSAADDPLPLVLGTSTNAGPAGTFNGSSNVGHTFSSTRHPKLTGSLSYVFGLTSASYHVSGGYFGFGANPPLTAVSTTTAGVVGDPTNAGWSLYQGGPPVCKAAISTSGNASSGSTRGGMRGYLKHFRSAQLPAHSFGDTFTVDGATYAGFGVSVAGLLPVAP